MIADNVIKHLFLSNSVYPKHFNIIELKILIYLKN